MGRPQDAATRLAPGRRLRLTLQPPLVRSTRYITELAATQETWPVTLTWTWPPTPSTGPRVIRMPRSRTSPQLPGTMTASPERMKLSGPTSARDRVNARRTALGIGPPDAPWSRCWRRPGWSTTKMCGNRKPPCPVSPPPLSSSGSLWIQAKSAVGALCERLSERRSGDEAEGRLGGLDQVLARVGGDDPLADTAALEHVGADD